MRKKSLPEKINPFKLTAKEKLYRAFDIMYDRYPYLASIVASWRVTNFEGIPTAATDGPNLMYNTKFIDSLNVSETTDVILHEAGHVFLGHHFRFERSVFERYGPILNIGLDLALNDTIGRLMDQEGKI